MNYNKNFCERHWQLSRQKNELKVIETNTTDYTNPFFLIRDENENLKHSNDHSRSLAGLWLMHIRTSYSMESLLMTQSQAVSYSFIYEFIQLIFIEQLISDRLLPPGTRVAIIISKGAEVPSNNFLFSKKTLKIHNIFLTKNVLQRVHTMCHEREYYIWEGYLWRSDIRRMSLLLWQKYPGKNGEGKVEKGGRSSEREENPDSQ